MQTFLPYPNFYLTAVCLDYKRLGKQRVETKQILSSLFSLRTTGWKNHPATKMWEGYEKCLCLYGIVITKEWVIRGYKDNTFPWFIESYKKLESEVKYPPWFGREDFHLSHQSNLIRKFPEHYNKYFPGIPNNLSYVWP